MSVLPLVRLAGPEDEEPLLEMCCHLHKENGLFTLDEDCVRALIRRYYQRDRVIIGVIGLPGKLQASTCLEQSKFYYTDEWHLEEFWNFVEEPFRRSRNAEALVQFGKSCAEHMNMPLVTGIVTNTRMAGKVRLYRRMLGPPAGAYFVHNTKWNTEPVKDHTELLRELREAATLCNSSPTYGSFKEISAAAKSLRKLAPLLSRAADAIDGLDDLWGTKASPKKSQAQ